MAKKVLIIEDDSILQSAVKDSLSDAGFTILTAGDGKDGFKKAKEEKPDLILLDLILPKEDGYHVLSQIHNDKNLTHIPVLVFTVIDSETSIAECVASGAKGYFIKSNYTLDDIVKKVKEHV